MVAAGRRHHLSRSLTASRLAAAAAAVAAHHRAAAGDAGHRSPAAAGHGQPRRMTPTDSAAAGTRLSLNHEPFGAAHKRARRASTARVAHRAGRIGDNGRVSTADNRSAGTAAGPPTDGGSSPPPPASRKLWAAWTAAEREAFEHSLRSAVDGTPDTGIAAVLKRLVVGAGAVAMGVMAASDEGVPPVWSELTIPQIREVVLLSEATGWALTHAPSEAMLVALLAAAPDDRVNVLLSFEREILDALNSALNELHPRAAPDIARFVGGARDAIAAHRTGLHGPSQALSACLLASLLDPKGPLAPVSVKSFGDFLAGLDPRATNLADLRFRVVAHAVGRAFKSAGSPAPPESFNRHASVHLYGPQHYSRARSLSGAMLTVSFLSEADWFLRRVRGAQRAPVRGVTAG